MAIKNHSKSKKISEMIALSKLPEHKEHSWIPIAQYDSRVNTYTNIAINMNAVTDYIIAKTTAYSSEAVNNIYKDISSYKDLSYSYTINTVNETDKRLISYINNLNDNINNISSYLTGIDKHIEEWISFSNIKNAKTEAELKQYIESNEVSYNISKAIQNDTKAYISAAFDWQMIK